MPFAAVKTSIRVVVAVLPALAILTAAASAGASDHRLCLPVRLTGVGQDLGPDSQGRLRTAATVSFAGYAIGTTNATFTPAGPPVGSDLSFAGPIVFVPRDGTSTLTADVQGSVDLSSGAFHATSTTVSGTGSFGGVSGDLTFRGTENLATGAFSETISGRLCSALR